MGNDPTQSATSDAPVVNSIPQSTGEKVISGVGGVLKAGSGQSFQGSDLEAAIQKHYQQRLEEARMNAQSAATAKAALMHNFDPETGQPLTDESRQKYQMRYDTAYAAYSKAAGVNKEAKGILARGKAIIDHFTGKADAARAQGQSVGAGGTQQPQSTPQSGMPAPPQPTTQGSGMLPGGMQDATGAQPMPGKGMPPPPAPTPQRNTQADEVINGPGERAAIERQQTLDAYKQKVKIDSDAKIAEERAKVRPSKVYTDPDGTPFMGKEDENGQVVNNETGQPVTGALATTPGALIPKRFNYTGADGKPQVGYQVGHKFYSLDGKELPMGTEAFSAWMQPRFTETHTLKEVTQPDGSIELVPVTTESTTTRGVPPGSKSSPQTPPPSSGTKKSAAAGAPGPMGEHGRVVGGKVPPGVAKAYETYNGAQERYAVMEDALPKAQAGNQQASLNLLANHIGMTMGLQKGARITQAIYEEAAQSSPLIARIEAHFDKDGYLTGVVLTPDQMTQMIDLAKVRLEQDRQAWQREIRAAKSGYGMTPDKGAPAKPSAKPGMSAPPAATPKTADEYLQSIGAPH